MSLNYNIIDSLKLYSLAFKNNLFIAIILSIVMLDIIVLINKGRNYIKYFIMLLNVIILGFILYYYLGDILTFKFSNPINNIYFYFLNSILFLILFSLFLKKDKYNITNYIFYSLSLINLIYALFMTYYLGNHTLIVIGNIFPMIKFGNIIYIIYYILIVFRLIFDKKNIK